MEIVSPCCAPTLLNVSKSWGLHVAKILWAHPPIRWDVYELLPNVARRSNPQLHVRIMPSSNVHTGLARSCRFSGSELGPRVSGISSSTNRLLRSFLCWQD